MWLVLIKLYPHLHALLTVPTLGTQYLSIALKRKTSSHQRAIHNYLWRIHTCASPYVLTTVFFFASFDCQFFLILMLSHSFLSCASMFSLILILYYYLCYHLLHVFVLTIMLPVHLTFTSLSWTSDWFLFGFPMQLQFEFWWTLWRLPRIAEL